MARRQRTWSKDDIRVREQDPSGALGFGGELKRMRFSQPAWRKLVDVEHVKSSIFAGQFFEYFAGRVGRAIIDGNHGECGIILSQNRSQSRFHAGCLIARCKDDRQSRPGLLIELIRQVGEPMAFIPMTQDREHLHQPCRRRENREEVDQPLDDRPETHFAHRVSHFPESGCRCSVLCESRPRRRRIAVSVSFWFRG